MEWMTVSQAAAMLGITRRRVHQLIERGKLEAQQVDGRLWLIRRESVEARRPRARDG